MTARTIDVGGLSDSKISSQAPLWWGQMGIVCVEGTMFCILIAMYYYIRLTYGTFPPPGTGVPPVLLPSLGLIPLLISCYGSYLASEGAKQGSRGSMTIGLLVNVGGAAAFLALRTIAWLKLDFNWQAGAYGSIVWTILFLHTLDAVADVVFTLVLVAILIRGSYGAELRIGVHVDSLVWYFLSAIWIPLYVTLYWAPRFAGGAR